MDDLSGQVIKSYELVERIGIGSFGMVYRAHQRQVKREVAIKIISPRFANHPDFIRAFEAEAQLIARLEHLHIVPLYDYWREPDSAYLVMRWLRGGSMRESISQGPWAIAAVRQVLDQIAAALTTAHRMGVVHRDIKPANILLDLEGNAFLTDFGIATQVRDAGAAGGQQASIGSPAYVSPEAITHEPVTPRSDIYSLGIVLYELLTGRLPFSAETETELLHRHLYEPMPSLLDAKADLPPALDAVIWRATSKAVDARYPDALSLAADFQRAILSSQAAPGITVPAAGVRQPLVGDQTQVLDNGDDGRTDVGVGTLVLDQMWEPENPYKGLRAFEQADAVDFYGRDTLIAQLVARFQGGEKAQRFLAVVGPSGSGKSSVVKAGLVPALRDGALPGSRNWFVAEMVPGDNPLRELEAALLSVAVNPAADLTGLLRAGERGILAAVERILPPEPQIELLLVIDQFEETFTQVLADANRRFFLRSLTTAVTAPDSRLRAVITLRADFYDRPLLYEGFGALIRERTEVVLPLSTAELEQAIVGPAQRVGLLAEPNLVTAIIADVNEQPGALPLLQYALTEIFERREGQRLSLRAYQDSGGVTGALARRAEEVYLMLGEEGQAMTRQLFLRLISLSEGMEDTRRRLHWAEVASLARDFPVVEAVLDAFTRYRLLTLDRDPATRESTVEVAHEALIREWARLREWLDDNRVGVQLQRLLGAAAQEWYEADQDPGFLLKDARLAQFEEWAAATTLQLTAEEKAFLVASLAEREKQEALEGERRAREQALERRARTWLLGLVGVLAMATVIALLLTYFASAQRQIAEARLSEIQSLSITENAQRALDDGDGDLALALALSAVPAMDSEEPVLPQARQTLYRAAYAPGTRLLFDDHQAPLIGVAFSPDGTLAASASGRINPLDLPADNSVRIWETTTGTVVHWLNEERGGHTDSVTDAVFSPDGRMLASSSADRSIILWDVASGQVIRRLLGHGDWINRLAFTPDGRRLLSCSGNFLITIIPLPFLPASEDTTVRLWDVETGELLRIFGSDGAGHRGPVMSLRLSPDGRFAASGDATGLIIIWDVETGQEVRRLESPGDWVNSLDFDPDGRLLISGLGKPSIGGSGSSSTVAALWDLETGQRLRDLVGHTNVVIGAAISPDGRTALTGSADRTLRLWDVASGEPLARLVGHDDWVFDVAFSPDGRRALSASVDSTARVWNLFDGSYLGSFATDRVAGVRAVDISADGSRVVAGDDEMRVILWDAATGEAIRRFGEGGGGHTTDVTAVVFSPDERLVLSADLDGVIILWDAATGEAIRRFEGHGNAVMALAFSPDGAQAISGSGDPASRIPGEDNTVRLWEVATGREIRRFEGHQDVIWDVAFSPDGSLIASASGNSVQVSGDNSVRLWDAATGEQVRLLLGHTDIANSVSFSPDGKLLLTSSDDATMRLWSVQTGAELRRLEGHTSFISTSLYGPDGRFVISGSEDRTIRLWDAFTGEEINRYTGHAATIWDLALSADGRTLVSSSSDGEIRRWRIDQDLDQLRDWLVDNRYLRDLTCTERAMYHMQPYCE